MSSNERLELELLNLAFVSTCGVRNLLNAVLAARFFNEGLSRTFLEVCADGSLNISALNVWTLSFSLIVSLSSSALTLLLLLLMLLMLL